MNTSTELNANTKVVDSDAEGGIVMCCPEHADELGELADFFDHPAPIREAGRFALAIGIRKDIRHFRKDWAKKGKARNLAHLNGQFDEAGKYDFSLLFELLGIRDEQVSLNVQISEFISGGMKWISQNEISDGTNFSVLKESFSELFKQDNV